MDALFILCGIACIVETVMMLRGKDFLLFWGYPDREKEFDLPALCKAEWWLFAIDGALCLIIGGASQYTKLNMVCIGLAFATLVGHIVNFRNPKYKKKK